MSTERQEAKAEAAAAKAREKALRPWYKKKRYLIPLALVAVIGISAAAGGGTKDVATKTDNAAQGAVDGAASGIRSESDNDTNPPEADVKLDNCAVNDALGIPEGGGMIHNNSSEPSNYTIHVDFLQGTTRVAQGLALETEVQANQDVAWRATGDKQVTGGVTCRVTRVERYAS